MNRRAFLKGFIGVCLLVGIATGLGYRYRQGLLRRYTHPWLDESSDQGILSPDEFQIIEAISAVISPKPAPPSEELREYVNSRTSGFKGFFREYRRAVALFDSRARKQGSKSFAALNEETRKKVLEDILLEPTVTKPRTVFERKIQTLYRVFSFRGERRFKEFIFPDLVTFYWTSSAGWAAVGYHSRPGVPDRDPRSYAYPPAIASHGQSYESY